MICPTCFTILIQVPDADDEFGCCGQGLTLLCARCSQQPNRFDSGATIGDRPDAFRESVIITARNEEEACPWS